MALFPLGAAAPASAAAPDQGQGGDPNLTFISPRNVNYVTEEAFVGALERTVGYDARLDFPNTVSVLVPRDGLFVGMSTKNGVLIEKGDPIATFSVVANELEIDEAALALELAESAYRREVSNLEAALEAAREAVASSSGGPGGNNGAGGPGGADDPGDPSRLLELAAMEAEENLNFAIYNGGRNLEYMRGNLAQLRERNEDFTVYAPISGYVYDVVYFSEGRSVWRNQFICRISDPDQYQLVVTAAGLTQMRLGAQVSIETSRRDAPTFPGIVTGNTVLLDRRESENRAVVKFADEQGFLDYGGGSLLKLVGLRYRVVINQSDISNVLLAPRKAINTESTYRFVHILEDGLSKKRYVLVGLSNMEYVQILDGIKAGDALIMN